MNGDCITNLRLDNIKEIVERERDEDEEKRERLWIGKEFEQKGFTE